MITKSYTHEQFIHMVRDAVVARAHVKGTIDDDESAKLNHTKLVYGVGDGSYRGITAYQAWQNGVGKVDVIEIAATGEESWVQLVGTTIHELAHVLEGHGAGHEKAWRGGCERLGLKRAKASGTQYRLAQFDPWVREVASTLAKSVGDGRPEFMTITGVRLVVGSRPCSQGIGSRGGKSRGKGSGSRLRLYECTGCDHPQKVRVASDTLNATHNDCGTEFVLVVK